MLFLFTQFYVLSVLAEFSANSISQVSVISFLIFMILRFMICSVTFLYCRGATSLFFISRFVTGPRDRVDEYR